MASEAKTSDESITLTFEVKNTGKMAADEVAQIYLSPSASQTANLKPQTLQGFARIPLQPGEQKQVTVKLYTEQLGYYSNNGKRQWNIAPGTYTLKVGASSADIKLQSEVTLKGEPVVKPLRDHYFSETTIQ